MLTFFCSVAGLAKGLCLLVDARNGVLGTLALLTLLAACTSASGPLSITLYNAKTNQTLTCKARDTLGRTDPAILSATVENCARELEARGFVRQ